MCSRSVRPCTGIGCELLRAWNRLQQSAVSHRIAVPEMVAYSSGPGSDLARPIRLRTYHMAARLLFTIALQRSCQHKRQAVRLYRALAEREHNALRRALLLKLATYEEQRGRRYAVWLEQLGAPVPEDRESLGDRWWRWVLVRCGVACALAWTDGSSGGTDGSC